MEEIDILIKTIKELHQNTVFIEQDYNGYYVNTDEFFEKLKHTLEDRIKPKLEWEQSPSSNPMTWDEATQYADSLNTMSDYGWRLPTIEELKEAYDSKLNSFRSDDYWSSSTYPQGTNDTWVIDFSNGYAHGNDKAVRVFVRCVREVK